MKCVYTKMRLTCIAYIILPALITETIDTFNCYINNLALLKTSKR